VVDAGDLTLCKSVPSGDESAGTEKVEIPEGGIVMGDVEKNLMLEALRKTEGNQSAAARLLGISRQTLIYRMQKHGIRGSAGKPREP
jgi:transcriptional regulator of acetoin/glycerol metabolism